MNMGMFAGWIFLAVHFNHWWIALFGLFTVFKTASAEK